MLNLDIGITLQNANLPPFSITANVTSNLEQNIVGVFGPSGCGKSTLLKAIAGLIGPQFTGDIRVEFAGEALQSHKAHQRDIVFVGQRDPLFPHLTVEQNLDFVLKHGEYGTRCVFTKAQVVAWCGISGMLGQSVSHLSGGETQRVLFARALLSGKSLLLLDEAFSALDWRSRQEMLQLVVKLHQEFRLKFILVSHSLKELGLCCDRIWQIEAGCLVAEGPSQAMIHQLALHQSAPTLSQLLVEFVAEDSEFNVCRWRLVGDDMNFELYSHPHLYQESQFHLVVDANKVVLSTTQPVNSSMLNQVSGVVADILHTQDAVLVSVSVAGQSIIAEVSKLSCERLALKIGQPVFAQFKLV